MTRSALPTFAVLPLKRRRRCFPGEVTQFSLTFCLMEYRITKRCGRREDRLLSCKKTRARPTVIEADLTSLRYGFPVPRPHARSHCSVAPLGVAGTLSSYCPTGAFPKVTSCRRSLGLNVTVICVSTGL